MKNFFISASFLLLCGVSFAQCDGVRYREFVFSEFTEFENIVYGSNFDMNGTMQELLLDVYMPFGDSETERPLVILAHGGSFMFGSKDENDVVPLAEDLVRMGYVVASMNYRLGIPLFPLDFEVPATEAVVRGFHDMKAAIRFFRKDIAENGNVYGVDTERIYVGGVSAGGFIALHNGYMNDEENLPDYLDYTEAGLGGGIEGESGNLGYSSAISGVVNICGAIKDTAYMEADDPPLLSFHGTEDTVVPYGSDILYLLTAFPVTDVDGSASVAEKADELGIENCFEIHEGLGHVPHVDNAAVYDTTLSLISNFLSHQICPEIDLDCSYREILPLSVEEDEMYTFKVWPNPVDNAFRLEIPGNRTREEMEIIDNQGRVVKRFRPTGLVTQVEVSELATGIYFIRSTRNPIIAARVVKR